MADDFDDRGAFNEQLHPRIPTGSGGGEFTAAPPPPKHKGGKAPAKAPAKAPGHTSTHSPGHKGTPAKITGALSYDPHHNTGPGYGVKGGDARVHKLQAALNRLGITDGHGKALATDGKLGPLTTQAVKAAQKRLGLAQDGKLTQDLLDRLTHTKPAAHAKPLAHAKHVPHRDLGDEEYPAVYVSQRAEMSGASINDLPDSDFAYIEPGGSKDSEGKTTPRSKRHFPIHDAAHARNALARAAQSPFGDKAMPKIKAACKKFGIAVSDRSMSGWTSDTEGGLAMAAVERRFTLVTVEPRGLPGEAARIGGYAAMFNKVSQNLGGFVEVVERSFFNKSRGDGWPDVMCRYNHDDNMLLGTTGARTLTLSLDETGLDYDCMPPQARADVVELVNRGDVRRSSFAFRVPSGGEDWGLSDQGYPMRHLVTGQLVDVAPVNAPAYIDTSVGLRSLDPTEVRKLGLGPEAAYHSLAQRMEADVAEVRAAAEANELHRFFRLSSDAPMPGPKPKPRLFGPAAALALLARKTDPWD